ncbi:OsmC family protein [Solicola sp. PLA-1-18]|uniref:OsmC family protein n=1 Tax=Solicola sp. PLA-1-18 TaxID=3380532 RepID=UPI003B7A9183
MSTHVYDTHLVWDGTTADGYRAYPRAHRAVAPPAVAEVALSADPHFRGDPDRLNPEQLVVMAASSCQLLSFLAVAARAGVVVTGYSDEARGEMPEDDPPMRITRIVLAPVVTVAGGTDADHVVRLLHEAHEGCYVARSLRTDVVLDPTVVLA